MDFTIVTEDVGATSVHDLKPNGRNIPVTKDNRIEYIHLVADYKLNKQIRQQCNAFRYVDFLPLHFYDTTNQLKTNFADKA